MTEGLIVKFIRIIVVTDAELVSSLMRVARRAGEGSALVARACGAYLLLRGTARAHDSARTGLLSWSPNAPSL